MSTATESILSRLIELYADIMLSPRDNLKLVKSLLIDAQKRRKLGDNPILAFEIEADSSSGKQFIIEFDGFIINCGSDSAPFSPLQLRRAAPLDEDDGAAEIGRTRVEVETLSMEQVSYLCMQYAHFDHC